MTPADAEALWGPDVVARALAEPEPERVTAELAREVEAQARELTDGAFARWALTLPWPRFCAVVRLTAGVTRRDLLSGREE